MPITFPACLQLQKKQEKRIGGSCMAPAADFVTNKQIFKNYR